MNSTQLFNGDCRDFLQSLPNDSVDCVITDPVWPNAIDTLIGASDPYKLFAETAKYFPRIAKTAVVHLGCTSDPRFLKGIPEIMPFLRTVWLRYNFPSYRGRMLIGSDVAYAFGDPPKSRKGNHLIKGEVTCNDSSMNVAMKNRGSHPTPRKLEHVIALVEMFTSPGDTVLDPFMGSGTTGEACVRLGRNFIGIEIDNNFFQIAKQRIESSQMPLLSA